MTQDPHTAGLTGAVIHDAIVPARAPWLHTIRAGQTLRIVDLEGNQAVDFLLYSADDDAERYSMQDTVSAQGNLFLREGTVLRSNEGRAMMTIAATSVEYHDTIGGPARANPILCAMATTPNRNMPAWKISLRPI